MTHNEQARSIIAEWLGESEGYSLRVERFQEMLEGHFGHDLDGTFVSDLNEWLVGLVEYTLERAR